VIFFIKAQFSYKEQIALIQNVKQLKPVKIISK